MQVGNATSKAATTLRKRLLERAGEVLEADAADLVIEDGVIGVRGAPSKKVPVTEVIPNEGLEVLESFDPKRPIAYSSGCHAAVVAVDPDTGQVEILRYVIAHDTGQADQRAHRRGPDARRLRPRTRLRPLRGCDL